MLRTTITASALMAILLLGVAGADDKKSPADIDKEILELAKNQMRAQTITVKKGEVSAEYAFRQDDMSALDDFDFKGWDNLEHLGSGAWNHWRGDGIWLAAGSQRKGLMHHKQRLVGDWTVEFKLRFDRLPERGVFGVVLSDKLSLLWGCQPIDTKKLAALDKSPKLKQRESINAWNDTSLKIVKKGQRLEAFLGGRKILEHELDGKKDKGKLDELRLGFYGANVTFSVSDLKIKGYLPDYSPEALAAMLAELGQDPAGESSETDDDGQGTQEKGCGEQ